MIFQVGGVLRDSMRQFMRDHVDGLGEVGEPLFVSVSENHFASVPKRVVELIPIVNVAGQRQSPIVDRVPVEHLLIEISSRAEPVKRAIDRIVVGGGPSFCAAESGSGQKLHAPTTLFGPFTFSS